MSAGSAALIGFAAMAAAFGLLRRTAVLHLVSVAAVAACVGVCATGSASTPASCAVAVAGLVGWWLGLLLVHTMFRRSVSLTLLIAASGGEDTTRAQIASRLGEALDHGLIDRQGDELQLTDRGRLVVGCARMADRALGRVR